MTGKFREPPTTRGLRSGTRLNGVYEVERLIGVGGMGEVYKGRVIQTGDAVAIKIIRPELAQNEDALALFRKEAAALHNLYHEAIVRYYLFSVDPDLGAPYLSMEYVDGQPLSEILKRGPLTLESTRILQRRLASGLQAAHNVGIVHRDVSPDNIILPSSDVARAKIVDFGIARSMLLGDSTVIGRGFAGKLSYVSPEQVGLYGGEVTPKSDIYSLGLVLAEAIIGRPLDMGGSQVDVVEKRRRVPDLSAVDRHLCPLLQCMLQPRPGDRIATMAEVAAWQEGNWSMSRKKWLAVTVGLVCAAGLAGVTMWELSGMTTPENSSVERSSSQATHPLMPTPDPAVTEQDRLQGLPGSINPPPVSAPPPKAGLDNGRPPEPVGEPATAHVTRYVRDYHGGPCFYLAPVNVSGAAATIEGYGSSQAAFEEFIRAFERAIGFEPQVELRLITDAQCPAVAFMERIGMNLQTAPRLQLTSFNLRDSAPLNGKAERFGDRHIELLIVSDDGYVYNLNAGDCIKKERGSANFNCRLKLSRPIDKEVRPQLLFAISSSRPLTLVATDKPIEAEALFPLLEAEIRSPDITADLAVKYFRLQK